MISQLTYLELSVVGFTLNWQIKSDSELFRATEI